MLIAAAYIRVSTEEQIEFSPDSQLKRILEYAGRNDIRIPEQYIFVDEGISGRTASKRPAFQRMIRLARMERPFQQILVWKFSRFARSRQDSIFYKSMLRKDCGIDVVSITEPLSPDPTSILIEALLEAMDEYYSVNLAEEVRRGMQERFSRGKAISIPPFGYRMGKDGFEPYPNQAVWIPVIFKDYAGGKSLHEISDKLNLAGITTSRGNRFQPRNILYILNNPVYLGKLRKRSAGYSDETEADSAPILSSSYDRNYLFTPMETVDGNHTPLIEESLWMRVQNRLHQEIPGRGNESPAMTSRRVTPDSDTYYLQRLIRCDHCGRHLIQIQKGEAFQCSGYNHGTCTESHYIKRPQLERMVLDTTAPLLPAPANIFLQQSARKPAERNDILRLLPYRLIYNRKKQILELIPEDSEA